ncbi:hypothetical protein [Legionella israelensis]|uniref:Uncharacterized protein n=1 Tax=Legionella israelensis TaxID=454 RepID=A0A0W0VIW0_9GAMM|nr:hypothetical protein [Legionella israelensis]KTD20035.1 hypothetical protein Lisr_1885 [Legionella israelensis]QBS09115.1 hypothetical protein E4T55_04165 [Legionella israelensis]SCY50293.1 hypothetical protein SAMN02746069_02672 [Legionella israelensis DSM 19235]STX58844.1 Uncharacterised protein [Legionella israelensis]
MLRQGCVVLSVFFCLNAFAVQNTAVLNEKSSFQGINVISNNRITIKPGYHIKLLSRSSFQVMARDNTSVGGKFECNCQLSGSGGCDIVVSPTSVSCATSTCSKSCYIVVTIPSKVIQSKPMMKLR